MRLAHFQGQTFGKRGSYWHFIQQAAIDTWYGHGAAFTACLDSLPQRMEAVSSEEHGHLCPIIESVDAGAMCFHPYRINAGIGSAPSGQILECLTDINLLVVKDGSLVLHARHLESLWN